MIIIFFKDLLHQKKSNPKLPFTTQQQISHPLTQPKILAKNSEQLSTQTNNRAILAILPESVMSITPTHLWTDKHHFQIH